MAERTSRRRSFKQFKQCVPFHHAMSSLGGSYNDKGRFYLRGNSSPWAKLPAVLQHSVWVFADPWPLVMSLRQVCKEWRTRLDTFKPNAPSAEVAYKQGRQIERDADARERDRKRAKRVKKREREGNTRER